ncbi:MAG: ribosome biogenesis GTPase YlqF [Methylococcaceae bacterium]|jgi:ribosome biogenesis GTPase A
MLIQWFPGHMHKASKDIKAILPKVDLIIEILDARIPFSSENPMLKHLRGDKPCIKVLSKYDLADPDTCNLWQDFLEKDQGVKSLAVSILQPEKIHTIPDLCHKLVPIKAAAGKQIQALILGIPNVGKSSLINVLADRMIAKTGNEPAITKHQQRIKINNGLVLLDTPGMLWGNIKNKNSGYRLAATGAIKDTAINHEDVAFFTADYLLQHYPNLLKARFNWTQLPATEAELMAAIGKKRGCLRAGGTIDMDKTAKLLLAELRSGKLGKISMETPSMMLSELTELAAIQAAKLNKDSL